MPYRPPIITVSSDALIVLATTYSMMCGSPFVHQYGLIRGALSHLAVGLITTAIGKAVHVVAEQIFAPSGSRVGAYLALGAGAVGLYCGYPAGVIATNYLNHSFDRNFPHPFFKETKKLFGAIDTLPYRVDFKAPPFVATAKPQVA